MDDRGASVLTEEDQQTHADGEDGAGAEGGQALGLHLAHLAALAPEAVGAAALEAVHRQRLARAPVTAGGGAAGRGGAALEARRLVRHRHLASGAPGIGWGRG